MEVVQRLLRSQQWTFIRPAVNQIIHGYPIGRKLFMESGVCNIVYWPAIFESDQVGVRVDIRVVFAGAWWHVHFPLGHSVLGKMQGTQFLNSIYAFLEFFGIPPFFQAV